jgi:glucarate dehydratase
VRIAAIDVWVVEVPLANAFTSSFETKRATTRTVIRVRADDGLEGWGETMRGAPTAAIVHDIAPQLIGRDPRAWAEVRRRAAMVPFFHGYVGYCAMADLEMALWDLSCKAANEPLHVRLGGAVRGRVPTTRLLTRADVPTPTPAALADAARNAVAEGGCTTLKFKGSSDATADVEVMRALRDALPAHQLRVDPNAAWSVPQSLHAARELEPLDLEYLEDPCQGLEGMARVRAEVRIPLCTNMCVVREEELAPAVRMGAVDIVHSDVHKWGGIGATVALQSVCRAFGLGVCFHSGFELGISTACHLHLAAAMDRLDHAIDSVYTLIADDVLTDRFALEDGAFTVPTGPGLGVTVDMDKLRHYAQDASR